MKKINIGLKSKKLGRIPSVSLPPQLSCRSDAPCSKLCYAKKGTFNYNNVKKAYLENYMLYSENKEQYFKTINDVLQDDVIIYKYFRWHMSGDIIDMDYLYGMVKLAKKNPKTKFLAFTKKFDLVNMYLAVNKLPKNLTIVYSAWNKGFEVPNPHNLPVAYVDFKNKLLNPDIPQDAKHCQNNCSTCKICWNLKSGQSTRLHEH